MKKKRGRKRGRSKRGDDSDPEVSIPNLAKKRRTNDKNSSYSNKSDQRLKKQLRKIMDNVVKYTDR